MAMNGQQKHQKQLKTLNKNQAKKYIKEQNFEKYEDFFINF